MTKTTPSATHDGLRVLIAGGGVAALEALFALRALAGDRVDLELVTPEPRFLYRPLSVQEPFTHASAPAFELSELAETAGARLTLGELASVDALRRVARTSHGAQIEYDALLVACGVRPFSAVSGALTFRGPADRERVELLIAAAERGDVASVLFVVPPGPTRPLPMVELAFQLRAEAPDVEIAIAAPPGGPLAQLGETASRLVAELLAAANIEIVPLDDAEASRRVDAVVAGPRLEGGRVLGLPADERGFVAIDGHGRVEGLYDVYAAGDMTSYPVRHGSVAAAQADAAAEAIAARAGVELDPQPFRPVLRAAILLGDRTLYVRRDLTDPGDTGAVSDEPLWSPPAKIATRYVAPVLAALASGSRARPRRSSIFANRRT